MRDIGFIVLSYFVTVGSIAALVFVTIRRGRALSRQVADQDKPWI